MNFWFVFGYDHYYPGGALHDLLGTFPTKESAERFVELHKSEKVIGPWGGVRSDCDEYEVWNMLEVAINHKNDFTYVEESV